jgi:hypothetical protein
MFTQPGKTASILTALMMIAFASCRSGPSPVKQPSIDATRAGKLAMEEYDKNGDGVVSGDELEKAPALKAALPRLDTNSDGGVSADEVTARVNVWKEMKTGMMTVPCHVTLNGQPLADAKITLDPEAFLGDDIKTSFATTDQSGTATPNIPKEQRADPKLPGGAHLGLYKVRISKIVNGKETIPARYNTETILGQEVSHDDPGIQANSILYAVKTP